MRNCFSVRLPACDCSLRGASLTEQAPSLVAEMSFL